MPNPINVWPYNRFGLETHTIVSAFAAWEGDGNKNAYLCSEVDKLLDQKDRVIKLQQNKILALEKRMGRLRGHFLRKRASR